MTREKKRRANFEDISSDTSKLAYKKNKKRQKHIGTKIVLGFLCALLVLFGGGLMGVSALMLNDLTTTVIPQDNESLGISAPEEKSGVINIALFGVEMSSAGETLVGPCAGTAIVSVDTGRNTVKVVSVSKDMLVETGVSGHEEEDPLCMAYAYGGPVRAIRALNIAFDLDIRDYIAVNMNGLQQILMAFGEETIDSAESVSETVLTAVSEMPPNEYPHVLAQVLGLTETSMFLDDILRLFTVLFDPFTVERIEVPGETVVYEEELQNDVTVIRPDKTQAIKTVHDFLYETPAINSRGAEVGATNDIEHAAK